MKAQPHPFQQALQMEAGTIHQLTPQTSESLLVAHSEYLKNLLNLSEEDWWQLVGSIAAEEEEAQKVYVKNLLELCEASRHLLELSCSLLTRSRMCWRISQRSRHQSKRATLIWMTHWITCYHLWISAALLGSP
jgi:hypothetical protein